jgi:hypothetical protein
MKRVVIGGIALAASLVLSLADAAAAVPAADPVFPRGLPYAIAEDACVGHRCVWNSQEQGNGEGEYSAILTRFRGDYRVKRISNERAARLTAAYCARPRVTCEGYWD